MTTTMMMAAAEDMQLRAISAATHTHTVKKVTNISAKLILQLNTYLDVFVLEDF